MALQFSIVVRNAELDSIEATIGTSPVLKMWTGAAPANCAAADTGSLLVSMNLPADWMTNASGGTKTLQGLWSGIATGTGTAGYFRIYNTAGATCGLQGSVAASGADLNLTTASISIGDTVTITTFTLTAANA